MFATATRNFVEEVDVGGSLIPVSSPNDTISVLTVVVGRKPLWFWQKPKYTPTDFKLNDILTGDPPIKPEITETDFIKYTGTYGENVQGIVDANFSPLHVQSSVTLEGKDSSKFQMSFGSLKKEVVDMQELLRDCKSRVLDMSHCLIIQTKEKPRRTFGIVKERIVTSQPCSVIEDVQQGGHCGGGLNLCVFAKPKVFLKDNVSLMKDSNVTMEIPVHTTIAFGITELEIKHDGCFELCLMSDIKGGFEVDGPPQPKAVGVTGAANNHLRQELEVLSKHFNVLSALPISTRSSLLQELTKVLEERGAVSALQSALDQVCLDERTTLRHITASESQNFPSILELLERSAQADQFAPALTALYVTVSAMDEMTDECLALLKACCSSEALHILDLLVRWVSGEAETPPSGGTEDFYERAEQLFACSNVSLKRGAGGSVLKAEIKQQPGHLPLILCIAIRGLASLAQ